MMTTRLVGHLAVPVAGEEDARKTAQRLVDYEFSSVTVIHVIEKANGAPDKLSVEQAQRRAADSFTAFRAIIPEADDEVVYRRDVVAGVLDAAEDIDATAVAFRPRGGNRIVQFLSGDTTLKLVTDAQCPVITLPDVEDRENWR